MYKVGRHIEENQLPSYARACDLGLL
jgi:hypothetical protein